MQKFKEKIMASNHRYVMRLSIPAVKRFPQSKFHSDTYWILMDVHVIQKCSKRFVQWHFKVWKEDENPLSYHVFQWLFILINNVDHKHWVSIDHKKSIFFFSFFIRANIINKIHESWLIAFRLWFGLYRICITTKW